MSIVEIINHPNYDATTFKNDIAILKVLGSFNCEQGKIYPACLPNKNVSYFHIRAIKPLIVNSQRYTYESWTDTIASGWGFTSFGSGISNTLQYVKVPPVSDTVCNGTDSYNGAIYSDTMICAGKDKKMTFPFNFIETLNS